MGEKHQNSVKPRKEPSAWTQTILAAMTNYIDAGSIVAGAAGLALWKEEFEMTSLQLGLLGAFSSNAISAAVGALIGGRICDKFGRKFVYTYDLVFYMLGMLLIIFAKNFVMLFVGYCVVGLAVGAGITASWTLIAEQAPTNTRARHCGTAQVAWALGPTIVLLLSVPLGKYGLLGNRIVFGHLFVVALITWLLRFKMPESENWKTNKEKEKLLIASGKIHKITWTDFFSEMINIRTVLFLTGVYAIWNLAAGTVGFYMQYVCEYVFGQTNQTANLLLALYFGITVIATFSIFMGLGDIVNRRLLYFILALCGVVAWSLLTYASYKKIFNIGVLIGFVVLFGINNGSCQQPFYQLWNSELFPTRYRAFAQGITFFTARLILGIWNIIFTKINEDGHFTRAAAIMVGFLVFSLLVGTIFTPDTAGKTLEQIEKERYGDTLH
jgi:inositol transporter-like SP family MFS transporter